MSKAFESIKRGLEQAVEYSKGNTKGSVITHYTLVDIKKIRGKLNMSQTEFSASFGINVETLRNWEQGKRPLNEFTANFLKVIEEDPAMVLKVIRRAS